MQIKVKAMKLYLFNNQASVVIVPASKKEWIIMKLRFYTYTQIKKTKRLENLALIFDFLLVQ